MRPLTKRELELLLRDSIPVFHANDNTPELDEMVIQKIRELLYKRDSITSANRETSEMYYTGARKLYETYRGHMGEISRKLTRTTMLEVVNIVYK